MSAWRSVDSKASQRGALRTYLASEEELFREVPLDALPPDHRLVYRTLRRGILGECVRLAWADEVEEVLATMRESPR